MADPQKLPDTDEASIEFSDLGINEDEREEINREIETLVSRGGTGSELAAEFLRPRRSGVLLPVIVWAAAAVVFAAGYLYLDWFFANRDDTAALESRSFFSTEAQLIEEILRESAQRLAAKDREIGDIQDRLEQLGEEQRALEAGIETEIESRAAALRQELEAELAAERRRLAAAGTSQADIDAQIAALEAEREAALAATVASLRDEARQAVATLEAQLATQQASLEQALGASRDERDQLLQEASAREDQLRAELQQELAALEDAERAALERIRGLQESQEAETLLADRILGSFTVVIQDIQRGALEEAVAGLDSLERLLRDVRSRTDAAEQRRQTELSLAGTLRGLVQEVDVLRQSLVLRDLTATSEETDQIEQERAAALIRTAAETVALAERARTEGRWNDARSLYQQALATIPSLNTVYPGILALESARRDAVLSGAVVEAGELLDEGRGRAAAQAYTDALELISADDADPLLAVSDGLGRALIGLQNELLDAQEAIEEEYRALLADRDRQIGTLNDTLTAARRAVTTAEEASAALRLELQRAEAQRAEIQTTSDERQRELTILRRDLAARDDEIARLSTALEAAQTRAASLERSLTAAQTAARTAADEAAAREAALRESLREATTASAQTGDASAATSEEVRELTESLDSARQDLADATAERDRIRASLEQAEAEVAGLERQIAALRDTRDSATTDLESLEGRIAELTQRVAELDERERELESLQARYRTALAAARQRVAAGGYDDARSELLSVFATPLATRLFPDLSPLLREAHEAIVAEAAGAASTESRTTALDDVVSLTTQVRRNMDAPRDAAAVQSYLRRFPDLNRVADEVFEIVELSTREVSAVEVEYRLLGSITRVTGNLVVVERLVTTPAAIGDAIEIRRTPQIRQEIGIASGTIIEVTEQRIVARVDGVYQIDAQPQTRDIVYIAVP